MDAQVIQAVLHNPVSERVTATLDAFVPSASYDVPSSRRVDRQETTHKRTLVVVTHLDPRTLLDPTDTDGVGWEQAMLVVLRPRSTTLDVGDILSPSVESVFPIAGHFALRMAQDRRSVVGLGTTLSVQQPKSNELAVTITPAEVDGEARTFLTQDIDRLKALLAECKRLKEIADQAAGSTDDAPGGYSAQSATDVTQWGIAWPWLDPYLKQQHSNQPPFTSNSAPPDLRIVCKPLSDRLAKATAGQPGDDVGDILLIREEWLRKRALSECADDQSEEAPQQTTAQLKIRIGTFNVNGKMPSQDLSDWVGGRRSTPPSSEAWRLPPTQTVSPLDMGTEKMLGITATTETSSTTDTASVVAESTDKTLGITETSSTVDTASVVTESADKTLGITATAETSSTADTASVVTVSTEATLVAGPNASISSTMAEAIEDNVADLLVFGFQELDLSAEALLYSTKTVREEAWTAAVLAGLGEKAESYEKLVSKQLVGMLLLVFVKKTLRARFDEIRVCSVGAGIMGMMGNKGATAIRLKYRPAGEPSMLPTVLTFVNAHLAAFDEGVDRRHADFHDLSRRLTFPMVSDEYPSRDVYESDCLFWLGDLNYRIDLPDGDVRSLLACSASRQYLQAMHQHDQLANGMRMRKAFEGFVERAIEHLPSYRFSPGVAADSLGYDLKRRPAWCDRILHMSNSWTTVVQQSYTSHPAITFSDHRPVSAEFLLSIPALASSSFDDAVLRLFRSVAALGEPDQQPPRLKIDTASVEFGKITFGVPYHKTLRLQNSGRTPCAYRLVPLDADSSIAPPWLNVEPACGLLLPDEIKELEVIIQVTREHSEKLNLSAKLECTLILHTVLGKDHFVSVKGTFERTCFGNPLSTLTRLPCPIRSLMWADDLLDNEKAINAPHEVMRLVNWLMEHATWMIAHQDQMRDLFLIPGEEDMVSTIRECLDTGTEFPFIRDDKTPNPSVLIAFGDTLLQFLRSLSEPIIPFESQSHCAQVTDRDEAIDILSALPGASINVWISITSFLHFVGLNTLDLAEDSGVSDTVEAIVAVFGPVLLRDDPTFTYRPLSPWSKRNFLMLFMN